MKEINDIKTKAKVHNGTIKLTLTNYLGPQTNNKRPRSEALETFSKGTLSTASAGGVVLPFSYIFQGKLPLARIEHLYSILYILL